MPVNSLQSAVRFYAYDNYNEESHLVCELGGI